jgi:stage III sporulation protein AB
VVKMLGGMLVFLVATLGGFQIAARYAERPKQLRHLISALQVLETEILYGATPLPSACRRIGRRTPQPVGPFFERVADYLGDGLGRAVEAAWREALDELVAESALKQVEREVLQSFGRTLGISDREDQIKHIRLAIAQLSSEEKDARDEQARNEKMWKYLGALLGLTVVILLY